MAEINREFLRGLYSIIKANDRYIKFNFVTGITKFAKASMFSGNNQLLDISLFPKFGNVCGYTHDDILDKFKDYLVDVDIEKVKRWYNGYNFLGERVYNPFDILQFCETKIYKSYWWSSGSAFSIIEMLRSGNYYIPKLENLEIDDMKLESFDIDKIPLESLLFQGGYLTIDYIEEFGEEREYKLKVPNLEVQMSLNKLFIDYLTGDINDLVRKNFIKSLQKGDLDTFRDNLISLFATIPYNNYVNNTISNFEGYYASVVYAYLASLGFEIIPEDVTNKGRIDITLKTANYIYIIEFKVGEGALKQIKEKKYYQKYQNKEVYLVGIEFDENEKNIKNFEWEKYKGGK
jgi:Holliday junction resolvase-like predicted endonuclease